VHVGVDIGGTFTDIVLQLPDGTLRVSKVSSTPEDPGLAVVTGLAALLRAAGVEPHAVTEVVHGTTVASNTILQKIGAVTGLITTRGFRDVLEIGRVRTPDLYDLTWEKPVPLVPRRRRLEVDERMGADGTVVRPLDETGVVRAAERLAAAGAQVIAICFINSHAEPRARAGRRAPRAPGRPWGRGSGGALEILGQPAQLRGRGACDIGCVRASSGAGARVALARSGVRAPVLVVASNGGVVGARQAAERPLFVVGSGPAAGVTGAARLGAALGEPNLIAFDMGGSTAKASLVESGQPTSPPSTSSARA
jgi:N-methylhydantoinase A